MMPNHQLTAEGYAWSDGGRELLSIIEAKIELYGGRAALYRTICAENNVYIEQVISTEPTTPYKTAKRNQIGYIVAMWNIYSTPTIANKLSISHDTVTLTAKMLKLGRNMASERLSYGQSYKKTTIVLDTSNGIFYENIMLAAKSKNMDWRYLYNRINDSIKNNTSFIRL